jgi:hypothetical protein
MEDLSAFSARPRLAALLDHFAEIADARQGWKVMYRCARCCSWWCAARSRAATITTTSSIGARRTSPSCAALPNSISAFPAPIGCAAS